MADQSRVAVVTGAARGIGRGIAERLSREGFEVSLWDTDAIGTETVAAAIRSEGGSANAVQVNVTDYRQVEDASAALFREFGRVDVLVNNAGGAGFEFFAESSEAQWDSVIALNYKGVLNTCRCIVPFMSTQQTGGRVVQIASDCAKIGCVGQAVYAGAKGAVISFSRSLARETASARVTVNVLCPGSTATPGFQENAATLDGDPRFSEFFPGGLVSAVIARIPLGRMGQPQDVAGAVAFLAGDDAAFLTGQVLSVDGGETMY